MADISLTMPRRRLFVGSYLRVGVRINSGSGLHFDDLDFKVDAGPKGGIVSE